MPIGCLMKGRMWIPLALFIAGVACIAVAAATGEAKVQLLIYFPLISGSGPIFLAGVLLIASSFILGFVLAFSSILEENARPLMPSEGRQARATESPQNRTRYGGVVLIGPVPIIFGSDRRMAFAMLVIAAVVIAVFLAIVLIKA